MTSNERARRKEQGRRVRMARKGVEELSQEDLATEVSKITGDDISRTIISNIERGARDAEVGILLAVADVTEVSKEWLLGDRTIPGYLNPWYGLGVTAVAS